MIEDRAGVRTRPRSRVSRASTASSSGPSDLSADLGLIGQIDHPTVQAAFDHVIESCLAAATKVGALGEAATLARRGVTLFTCFADGSLLGASAHQAVEEARAAWAAR